MKWIPTDMWVFQRYKSGNVWVRASCNVLAHYWYTAHCRASRSLKLVTQPRQVCETWQGTEGKLEIMSDWNGQSSTAWGFGQKKHAEGQRLNACPPFPRQWQVYSITLLSTFLQRFSKPTQLSWIQQWKVSSFCQQRDLQHNIYQHLWGFQKENSTSHHKEWVILINSSSKCGEK